MKIVAILGSPRGRKGSTITLLSEVVRGAEQAGALVSTLCLSDYEVRPCRGCEACHKLGSCTIKDDYAMFRNAMEHADGLILASPNYIFSVTAQLKALMDRSSLMIHCQSLLGKHGCAVVSSGSADHEQVQQHMLRFLRAMGCWTVGSIGAEAASLADPAAAKPILAQAAELGVRLVTSIAKRETFDEQAQEKQSFTRRMRELVESRQAQWPFEYEFWQLHRQEV